MSTVALVSWLQTESAGSIRWMTMDRPGRRNAVPPEGWTDLAEAFDAFEASPDRVMVVTGAGGDFCSGADLGPERAEGSTSVMVSHRRMKEVARAAVALHRVTKPVVAAVDGFAVGAGMNLALGCDVILATERARFAEIFVRRGLTVDFGGTWLLPRIVGLQRAKELALSGRIVEAAEAMEMGLVLEVVPVDRLRSRATELAESLLSGAPFAQMLTKQGIDASFESSFAESVGLEGRSQSIALQTEDGREGAAAFLDKREPEWKGR